MMQLGLSITLSCVLALSLALVLVLGGMGYRRQNKRGFSFLCEFPFELVEGGDSFSKASSFFAIVLSASSALCCTCSLWNASFLPYLALSILLAVFGLLRAVGMVLLYRIPAYQFKFHSLLTVLYFCFSALIACLEAIVFLNMRTVELIPSVAFMALEFLFGVLLCLLAINPKLAHWTELESSGTKDGGVEIHRPKPFVLAASEWAAMLLDVCSSLVFLLGIAYFVLKLNA